MRTVKKTVRESTKIILYFILGQLVQLVLHGTCMNFWNAYQIPFCAAGGLLIAAAMILGVRISAREAKEAVTHWEDMQ